MGVHTGDSITVRAGADADRPRISDDARRGARAACARSASIPAARTCSSPSIPQNGRMVIIEMNPRVSRSSALASKATGFPIAKIAAKLAVGYRLDEIQQRHHAQDAGLLRADHRLRGRRRFPRWQFEKFPGAEPTLGTQMKSVGEVMAIGRTFKAGALEGHAQPGNRQGRSAPRSSTPSLIAQQLITPTPGPPELHPLRLRAAATPSSEIHELTAIDPVVPASR